MNGLKFRDQPCSLINCDWMVRKVADLDSAAGGASSGATVTSPGPAMSRPGQCEQLSRKLFVRAYRVGCPKKPPASMLCWLTVEEPKAAGIPSSSVKNSCSSHEQHRER